MILAASALLLGFALGAQDYNPTSTWPYLYRDFQDGTIYMTQGTKMIQKMNIHIVHDKLHYIDNGIIKEVVPADILMVEIGADRFLSWNGAMYRIEAESDKGLVISSILTDLSELTETGGAYGSSSTSSATTKLSSFEVEGQVNQNHMLIWESRNEGADLRTKTTYYIKTPKTFAKATAKEIQNALPEEQKAGWKAWQKAHKVKWNKPESIVQVLELF